MAMANTQCIWVTTSTQCMLGGSCVSSTQLYTQQLQAHPDEGCQSGLSASTQGVLHRIIAILNITQPLGSLGTAQANMALLDDAHSNATS
jgi:hypothetical protein